MHVLAPCGSPRIVGFDRGLLRAVAGPAPEGVCVAVAEIGDVPPCHGVSGPRGRFAPGAASRDRLRARDVDGPAARPRRVGPAADGRTCATPPESGGPTQRP